MKLGHFCRFSDPALLILSRLADGPKHGYGMMTDILTLTGIRSPRHPLRRLAA